MEPRPLKYVEPTSDEPTGLQAEPVTIYGLPGIDEGPVEASDVTISAVPGEDISGSVQDALLDIYARLAAINSQLNE